MIASNDNISLYKINQWADFWHYKIGINIFPLDKDKATYENWSEYQGKAITDEIHEEWKRKGRYAKGIILMPGKVWRGENKGLYFVGIDFDKELGIKEFCNIIGANTSSIDELKEKFIVEQHANDPYSLHVYFYSEISFTDKSSDSILGIEIKSNGKGLMCATPSYHSETDSIWQIKGTDSPIILKSEEASKLMSNINDICSKYNIQYLKIGKDVSSSSVYLSPLIRQMIDSLEINSDIIIQEGARHSTLLSIVNSLLFKYWANEPNDEKKAKIEDELLDFLYNINNKLCKPEPIPEKELKTIWINAKEFVLKNKIDTMNNKSLDNLKVFQDKGNNCSFASKNEDKLILHLSSYTKNKSVSKKDDILRQLKPQIREELSKHIWELISYNPPRFLVAHSEYKQIVFALIKEKNVKKINNDKYGIENDTTQTISFFRFSQIVIGAIPVEIILNKNPSGLFDHRYIIKFLTQSNDSFTIGPKNIDEIVGHLKDRSLIYMSAKATEALSIIISAFERNGQLITKDDMDTPGFYFINRKIKQYDNVDNNSHPKPTVEEIVKCCELLEILQSKFKKKDVFPTLLKWSIMSPFDYVLKQVNKKWIPWIYLYGWSNTGKTTLGEICCCIWNRYHDKDAIVPFTAVYTKARFGEVLSKSTYPIVINEVAPLNDDKYRDMVEMIKTAITDTIARKKFVNKTMYIDIPSFSPCILTGNSIPPMDTGFRRRIIPIIFTEKDQYSEKEVKDFKNLFEQQIKDGQRILGDFTVNYEMENQEILIDGNKDWKEIAEHILEQMFKLARKEHPPEWIKYFVEEHQLKESKEDVELLFRSYLVNKINDTYNKYYRNIEKILIPNSDSTAEIPNLPFSNRLSFCLEHNLIPFLNPVTIADGRSMIIITSDLIYDIKGKIPSISSLNEVSQIIDGFEYGQKKLAGRNVRAAYGSKKQFLDFLGMD